MKPHTRLLKWSFPTACLLILVGVRASAQVNLLPQGNFESPGVNTGWAEGFNIPNNQEFQVISEHGKHWLRIENRDAGRQLDYVHAYVKVTPQIASLTVSVRMRATDLKIGKEGWHTARVAMMFEGGSFGYPERSGIKSGLRLGDEIGGVEGACGGNSSEHPARDVLLHRRVRDRRPHGHAPHGRADAVGRRRAAGWHRPGLGQDERQDGECKAGAGFPRRHLAIHSRSRSGGGATEAGVGLYQGAGRLADSPGQAFRFPGPRRWPAVGSL